VSEERIKNGDEGLNGEATKRPGVGLNLTEIEKPEEGENRENESKY
jgi:hypothetical protein